MLWSTVNGLGDVGAGLRIILRRVLGRPVNSLTRLRGRTRLVIGSVIEQADISPRAIRAAKMTSVTLR